MNILVVHFLFVLFKLSILVNLTTAGELGESACSYYGDFDKKNERCHKDVVKIKYLPEECTSYVYFGVTYNSELEIVPNYFEEDLKNIKSLAKRKPNNVFVYYQQTDTDGWHDALFTRGPRAEARKVKDFVDEYKLGGLILCGIEYDYLPDYYPKYKHFNNSVPLNIKKLKKWSLDIIKNYKHQNFNDGRDFYVSFSAYIKAFKTLMPDLKIGFFLRATELLSNWNNTKWFNLGKMNGDIDFYIIEFYSFNPCTDEFIHSGITPMVSTNPKVNTLTKFVEAFNGSSIAKDKVFFQFSINPTPKAEVEDSFMICEISYNEYCENDYDKTWCVDNENTFYEKGQFAKQYAKGFIASEIDLVDRDLKCKCNEDKYITFHMLLNGYKGAEKITCERLKF